MMTMMRQQQYHCGALSTAPRARAGGVPHSATRGGARDATLQLRRRRRPQAATGASASSSSASKTPRPPRAVVILPGLGNDASDYAPLADLLRRSGAAHVAVAPVERWNWALNALALADPSWWRGQLKPRPAVDWYIRRADEAVREAAAAVGPAGGRVTLLAHSAGGWIGRVYLRDYRKESSGGGSGIGSGSAGGEGGDDAKAEAGRAAARLVDRFVSLGSPHRAPPEGVVDQTRGILSSVEESCPGAHHHDEGVRYVTVGGRLVRGRALGGGGSSGDEGDDGNDDDDDDSANDGGPLARGLAAFAGVGYQQVCGRADSHGDFIVPIEAAHLGDPRAAEVDLEGVFHSPLGEKLRWPVGKRAPVLPPWYGHESVAGAWVRWAVGGEEELPEAGRRHRVRPVAWRAEEDQDEGGAESLTGAAAAAVVGVAALDAE